MSISRAEKSGRNGAAPAPSSAEVEKTGSAATYTLPLTVSRAALLDRGSDRRFRQLVYDLLTIAARMTMVREYLGRRIGISGPQYSIVMAVAQLQGECGVSVGAVAACLHVTSAFVAAETGKLVKLGLLLKRLNPEDRRGVLLSLSPAGRRRIDQLSPEIGAINDLFFGTLNRSAFDALSAAAAAMVGSSRKAVSYLAAMAEEPAPALDAAI